jgi:hypothetical protein
MTISHECAACRNQAAIGLTSIVRLFNNCKSSSAPLGELVKPAACLLRFTVVLF